jgi:hypothetical protein
VADGNRPVITGYVPVELIMVIKNLVALGDEYSMLMVLSASTAPGT